MTAHDGGVGGDGSAGGDGHGDVERKALTRTRLAELGRTARTLRHLQGISQQEVGEAMGTDQNMVSKTERGVRDIKVSTLWLLAGALGVHPADLLKAPADLHGVIRHVLRRAGDRGLGGGS